MLRKLMPRETNFFDYFERHAATTVRGARELASGRVAVSAGRQFGPTTSDRLTVLVPG